MSSETENARNVLRSVWAAQGDPSVLIDEDCSPNKSCKNMQGVTFDGFAEPGSDLQTAWREKLAREGKLRIGADSIRDLVLGSSE
ncbi:MAG TPA: hypothetical protein VMV52_01330 [Candidatus Nanopelagicaceae bacterium]|nr:hypothetical protein [Candidatus Nanopelagicaceae bacterium]